jgi:hypothetical protein
MTMDSSQQALSNSTQAKVVACALCALLFVFCSFGQAQQPKKTPRIGIVAGSNANNPGASIEAFQRGLRDVGYVERKNILVEYRYADGKWIVSRRL